MVGVIFTAYQVMVLSESIRIGHPPIEWQGEVNMSPDYTTTWESARGTEVVNTTCGTEPAGKTCLEHHNDKVTRAQAANPKI